MVGSRPPSLFNKTMSKKFKNIIIANDAEAFVSVISSIDNDSKRNAKINKEHFQSNRFLFWEGDDKVVITPFPIDKLILVQAQKIGYKNVENWFPQHIGISLSQSIIEDKQLLNKLIDVIRENQGITISCYCYTQSFVNLTNILRQEGLNFFVDQEPQKGALTLVDYIGSKVGFRKEMQKLDGIPKLEYFICDSKQEIINKISWFFQKGLSCVVKANAGEGGWGVLMINKNQYASIEDLQLRVEDLLTKDTIWNEGPFVVESLIESLADIQNSPSLEIFIDESGFYSTYLCNQIVNDKGVFMGILMGQDCLETYLAEEIQRIGNIIGEHYFKLGCRGFFDIDFIVSKDGTPYPIETNVRRTGGTHVYDLTKKIYGPDWMEKIVVLSKDSFKYGEVILPAQQIFERISKLLYPINQEDTGVVVTAINDNEPVFSFVVFGSSKENTIQLYDKLTSIWNNDNLNVL
jgi:hypothetical protein